MRACASPVNQLLAGFFFIITIFRWILSLIRTSKRNPVSFRIKHIGNVFVTLPNIYYTTVFQESSHPTLFLHCPFTQVHPLATSRTSTRSSVCLVRRHRKKSRKHTTRSAHTDCILWSFLRFRVDSCFLSTSDGQKVSSWHQQGWPTSQGKICSAGRSLRGFVSFFIQASLVVVKLSYENKI